MERLFEHGENCWFVANGCNVTKARVLQDDGYFCIIQTGEKRIRLRVNRLYKTESEAEQFVMWSVKKAERNTVAAEHSTGTRSLMRLMSPPERPLS